MRKSKSIIAAVIAAVSVLTMSVTTVFAADGYVNSVGSEAGDIAVLADESYQVKGQDATQNKKSEYSSITYADETVTSKCEVYATVAEGSSVYDPTNPDADENGFVDGSVVVSMPTVLIMNGTADPSGYYIAKGSGKVKGNIAGTTIINVVADSEFSMKQVGKDDISATVTQDFTKFVVSTSSVTGADVNKNVTPAFNDACSFNIDVKTNEATAGSWSGSYNNNIFLTTAA